MRKKEIRTEVLSAASDAKQVIIFTRSRYIKLTRDYSCRCMRTSKTSNADEKEVNVCSECKSTIFFEIIYL